MQDGHAQHTMKVRGRALGVTLGANATLFIVQIVGALLFGSLALIADSVHQASDVVGLIVAFVAFRLSEMPYTSTFTYGLRRAETLGAVANGVLLLGSGGWIMIEAVRRIGDPPEITGGGVIVLALVGIAVNSVSAWVLARVAGSNLNLRAAVLHLTFDAAGSVGVLISGAAAMAWQAYWVDLAVSFLLAGFILWSGFRLMVATTRVLLEGAPLDASLISAALADHPRVREVHHLHVWSLDSEHAALSGHIVVDEASLHDAQLLSEELQMMLEHRFGIGHATLALECHACEDAAADPTK
jgi:cobalt-zinc-cadmium efflux system protein